MLLIVDVWEKCLGPFHKAMYSNSRFGNFSLGHIRHEMAENVDSSRT